MSSKLSMEELFLAYVERSGQLVDLEYTKNAGISEEIVKELVYRELRKESYSVKKTSPRGKGPDIEGSSPKGRVIVEAKGEGSRPEMFHNFFLAALGQILMRMTDQNTRYIIALPIHEKFVRLVRQLPPNVREKLNLEFWLIGAKPVRYSIHILLPHSP